MARDDRRFKTSRALHEGAACRGSRKNEYSRVVFKGASMRRAR
jgi:hypothetical protein